ncbi:hypothetical protein [Pantoea agglomerans]|nr:hypothetical protein [Pantoea agglomerans]
MRIQSRPRRIQGDLSRYGASLTLALIIIALLVILPQRPAMKTATAS